MNHSMIRQAVTTDIPALVALLDELDDLHREAMPWLLQEFDGPGSREFIEPFLSKPDHAALVAEVPSQGIAGLLLVLVRDVSPVPIVRPARVAELDTLVVGSAFRRRGIGKALVEAGLRWAHDAGAARTELGVYEFNESARAFWSSVGFETLSRRLVQLHGR